jgi:hypothetical protein
VQNNIFIPETTLSCMVDYKKIRKTCVQSSNRFSQVVEDFLFKNVVNHKRFSEEISIRFVPYRHIIKEFQDSWVNLFMMQYFIHAILKKDGLLKKLLNHSAIKQLKPYEHDYLQQLTRDPWRFSFSTITGMPHENFFEMEDIFMGESFLLYSPGITDILHDRGINLWLNLIGYNGECWQSYGPIGAYEAFTADDIFFFATELNRNKWIETGEDLMADVESNPIPYMMLISGSTYPLTVHKNDLIVQVFAEYDVDTFKTKGLDRDFTIEYVSNVYRLALKRWSGNPHFSTAYYDEDRRTLRLYSMTDRGFKTLVNRLNSFGYDLSAEPDIRVTMAMSITTGKILKREIQLNDYDALFTKVQPTADQETIDKLNSLLAMALPDVNAGRKPDVKSLARKAGIDEETVETLLKQVMDKIDNMKKSSK